MTLGKRHRGYAVMSADLKGISLDGYSIEDLKSYCRNGDVIVERLPKVCGFSLRFYLFNGYSRSIRIKGGMNNIFNLHWMFMKEYCHKTGKIVYKS